MENLEIIFSRSGFGCILGGVLGLVAGFVAMQISINAMVRQHGGAAGEVAIAIPLGALGGAVLGGAVGLMYALYRIATTRRRTGG